MVVQILLNRRHLVLLSTFLPALSPVVVKLYLFLLFVSIVPFIMLFSRCLGWPVVRGRVCIVQRFLMYLLQ